MFDSLKTYYDYLEQDKNIVTNNYHLANLLSAIEPGNPEEKGFLKNEIYFNDLKFLKGNLVPKISSSSYSYPDLSLFNDGFKYIKSRASSKDYLNPKYKAKYYHLLWKSSIKHKSFAESAIGNYFSFLKELKIPKGDSLSQNEFVEIIENLFILCESINYHKRETKEFLKNVLISPDFSDYSKYVLIKFAINEGKKLEKKYTKFFYDYANGVIETELDFDLKKEYSLLLVKLSQKLGLSSKKYHNKLGGYYLEEAKKHLGSFIIHEFYLDAIIQYQKAGNKPKVEEVSILMEKAKDNINLKKIVVEESPSPKYIEIIKKIENEIKELVINGTSKDVYTYLTNDPVLFPRTNLNVADDQLSSIEDLMGKMYFDINKNVSRHKNQYEDNNSSKMFYQIYIENISIPFLRLIFCFGLQKGKVDFDSFKEHLEMNTWYGTTFENTNLDGEKILYRYLDLLLPGLDVFFQQFEILIKTSKNPKFNCMVSIDSIILKFEGVLRHFSRMIGVQTIENKEDGTVERISFDKLLGNPKLLTIVPEYDIQLFKFLFTADGLNLRNNIAHCFFMPQNYSIGLMWLLISAFLKLGDYKFEQNK